MIRISFLSSVEFTLLSRKRVFPSLSMCKYPSPSNFLNSPEDENGPIKKAKPLDPKYQKLKGDLDVVKGNIILTNEMIDAADPDDDVSENEVLKEMVQTISGMENKLFELIGKMKNEDMMNMALGLNDDLQ